MNRNTRNLFLSNSFSSMPNYPENHQTQKIEREAIETLPAIEGWHPGLSSEESIKLLGATAALQRSKFIQNNGSPFGEDLVVDNESHKVNEEVNISNIISADLGFA